MHRRKIQLIAGTTYSLSLPKEWIKKNKLKEKDEILIYEKDNETLTLSPHPVENKELNEISLDVDEHIYNLDQVLFAVYYTGVENICLHSKKELTKEVKSLIRKTLTHMSGTEIVYEDKQKITIKVLLDKSKININFALYRINTLIDSSISNLLGGLNITEIRINENEIDRLYHLIAKMVLLSLIDSDVLQTSNIKNKLLVPSYFLMGKKLENIGDNINHLSQYLFKTKSKCKTEKDIFNFIRTELGRCISYVTHDSSKIFRKIESEKLKMMEDRISGLEDKIIQNYLEGIIRFMVDIEDEIVNISFYNKLINDKIL
ncbi:MAG: phosphate uptake regulator PhoU [Candidatus Aenigmarchaeota archaeon]|nr:phosphate uptake regulator PhoU [Candidatus Aenigmarchaeota archaeon]